MASLKDTKRRILSVKNTQKITRAMKLVASSKYMRAVSSHTQARPYGDSFLDVVRAAVGSGQVDSTFLRHRKKESKVLLIVLATDRGLCGALNASLFKCAQEFLDSRQNEEKVSLELWGKKAILFGKNRPEHVVQQREKVLENPSYSFAKEVVDRFFSIFSSGEFDSIYVSYSSFRNALSQPPLIKKLLPIEESFLGKANAQSPSNNMLFEPHMDSMIEPLLFKYTVSVLYKILLEASSSEHAARMTAMDSATNNADKVIKNLTLEYNRVRQASITRELIEITSGAEALN